VLLPYQGPGGRWSGRPVELNAITSPQLMEFVEYKFEPVGVTKVVPSDTTLESACRRTHASAATHEAIDEATRRLRDHDRVRPEQESCHGIAGRPRRTLTEA
jgi:hypothetical protein